DFSAYPSVRLELGGPDGSQRQLDYLESELRVHSGFERVTSDVREPVSAVLEVELELDSSRDLFDDDNGYSYSGVAEYWLFDSAGQLVDSGEEAVDDEQTSFAAAESALDLVVYHYLRQYRL